jgi:phosphohistidine phosphatase
MKRLLLLRHGEAESAQAAASDFDRALTAHGRRQALEAAQHLQSAQYLPEAIVASPALRTRESALIVAAQLLRLQALQFDPRAYPGSPEALLQLIRTVPGESQTLLLVGHNPGLSVLARRLAAVCPAEPPAQELPELSTGELRCIELSASGWSQIDSEVSRVVRLP